LTSLSTPTPGPAGLAAQGSSSIPADWKDAFVPCTLLVVTFALGGTSGSIPIRGGVIELLAILAIIYSLTNWRAPRPHLIAIIATVVIVMLPIIQLVPLPPGIWTQLPGRELAADIARLGESSPWRPISLDSAATLIGGLSLLAPVGMFLAVLQTTSQQRMMLIATHACLAGLSLLLGAIQVTTGALYLYVVKVPVLLPTGFFSNRNHQALFLVTGALSAMIMASRVPRSRRAKFIWFGLAITLATGTFATASRAGMALLILPAILAVIMVRSDKLKWTHAVSGLVGILLLGLVLSRSSVVSHAIERFAGLETGRYTFWPEVWYSVKSYFPVGAGIGTFERTYQATENLDTVGKYYVNRAHNDYLELLLEVGAAAPVIFTVIGAFIALSARRILTLAPRSDDRMAVTLALFGLVACALHSLVDYPLRSFAHLTYFAMLLGFLCLPYERPLPATTR